MLPVIPFFSNKQQGAYFGERFTHAIENAFASGYDRLIICGTDTPHITSGQFNEVAQKLNDHQLVLGPSVDGGVYLIGLHKQAYNKEEFIKIDWNSHLVFQQLNSYAGHLSLSLFIDEKAPDIDHVNALYQSAQSHHWLSIFLQQLFSLFKRVTFSFHHISPIYLHPTTVASLRGPPHLSK